MKIITTYYVISGDYTGEKTWDKYSSEAKDLLTDRSVLDVMMDEIKRIYVNESYSDIRLLRTYQIPDGIRNGKEAVGFRCCYEDPRGIITEGLRVIYVDD